MNTAQEIREATARNVLHPLVACSFASPRGLCNAHFISHGGVFCTLDYGHDASTGHRNAEICWSMQWPPRRP